jgi:hypothetical protein
LIAEGNFTNETIEPSASWSQLLNEPTLIVSSADEHLRDNGGISQSIGVGCLIKSNLDIAIATGQIFPVECSGSYKKEFPNIRYVDRAIVVAWEGVPSRPNCMIFEPTAARTPEDKDRCLLEAITRSLGNLFYSPEMTGINTLVLPALGTGTGELPKDKFYHAVSDALSACHAQPECDERLPPRIILAIVSGGGSPWRETRDAIARSLADLNVAWRLHYSPKAPVAKEAQYLGVLLVLFAFLLGLSVRRFLPSTLRNWLPEYGGASLWRLIFGWFFVAVGAFAVFSDLLAVPVSVTSPHAIYAVISNVVIGMLAAAMCGLISRTTKSFESG